MAIWRLILLCMIIEMIYLNVDVMMFYSAAMFYENYLCMIGELLKL